MHPPAVFDTDKTTPASFALLGFAALCRPALPPLAAILLLFVRLTVSVFQTSHDDHFLLQCASALGDGSA